MWFKEGWKLAENYHNLMFIYDEFHASIKILYTISSIVLQNSTQKRHHSGKSILKHEMAVIMLFVFCQLIFV